MPERTKLARRALRVALAVCGAAALLAVQPTGAQPAPRLPRAPRPAPGTPDIAVVGRAHAAERDGLRIALWEKYAPSRLAGARRAGKVALLVHGATWSGRPDFDLQIRDYSLMDYLARHGYDVWAIDIHGYGRSDTTSKDWSTAETAVLDIDAAVDYIAKLRRVEAVNLLGWSWGTQTTGLYTMRHPEKVAKLILYAPAWKGPPGAKRDPAPTTQYRTNTEEGAREDFIPSESEPDVVELYVREALKADPRSPNGTRLDYLRLPILDPQRIAVPTMVIFGARDGGSVDEDLLPFFRLLATPERSYVVLPDDGHAVMLGKSHRRFQHEVRSFFDRP